MMQRLLIIVLFILLGLAVSHALLAQSGSPSNALPKSSATKTTGNKKARETNPAQKAIPKSADKNSPAKQPAVKSARELAFQRIDTSRDGKIDADEFLGGSVGKAADNKQTEFSEFDLNKDGSLDLEEFKKQGNKPPDRAKLSEDFKNRDKDANGSLTLKEFLGNRSGEQKTQAHTTFFRFDSDGNDQVTLKEFLDRDVNKKLSVHSIFCQHDLNDDKQLTEQEFMRTRLGKKTEQAGRENFRKFDLNRDSRLSESEFAMLPSNNPDSKVIFQGHDGNHDGQLTLQEYLAGRPEGKAQLTARDAFYRMDANSDGRLSEGEFVQHDPKTQSNLSAKGKAKAPITVTSHFRQLDLNDDKQLTEQEFMRTKIGKKTEQAGRESFRKFDLNRDSRLSESEFAMLPSNNPDSKALFQGHDGNHDGQLTLQEHLAGRPEGKSQLAARDAFYRMDANGDGRLSDSEFVSVSPKSKSDSKAKSDSGAKGKAKAPLNVTSHFRQLDLDNNGKVTEQEFMRLKAGKKGEQVGRDSFKKYDLDGNGQLTENELAILPAHKPDAASMFSALDVNRSGGLSPVELTRLMGPDQSDRAEGTFASYDKDGNGELSIDEYLARKLSIERQRSRRAWMRWLDTWGMRLLIGLDAILLLAGARWVYRRFGNSTLRNADRTRFGVTR